MTRNTPRIVLPDRTAHARRELAYWARRGARIAYRAAQRRCGNATGWDACGWALLLAGLAVLARSCPLWYHAPDSGGTTVFGGIYAAIGIVLLYFHGEAKRRGDRG